MSDAVTKSTCSAVLKALQKLYCTKPRAARDSLWGLFNDRRFVGWHEQNYRSP